MLGVDLAEDIREKSFFFYSSGWLGDFFMKVIKRHCFFF